MLRDEQYTYNRFSWIWLEILVGKLDETFAYDSSEWRERVRILLEQGWRELNL